MNMQNIIQLIKKSGFSCTLKKIKRYFFVNDKEIIGLMAINGAYDYLQKYKYALSFPRENLTVNATNPYPDKIWTMWLQGLDNAPEIIQKCMANIQKHYGDEVIIITNENMSHFLDIPHFMIEKNKKGIISNTHYSDIVRFLLIEKYGGLWLDSTTFLLGNIPDYIRYADVFFYKVANDKIMGSINVMAAKPHHPIICKTISLMLEYWKNENRTISYSITMMLLAMAIHSSQEMESIWNSVPSVNCNNKDLLLQKLFDEYDAKHIEVMKQLSMIQKLSYKFSKENYELQGTFYDVLVRKG
jgi:mannosyltransferase OCH1-like enzyme